MCGIAGFYNPDGLSTDSKPILKRMLARILYRGPDESGIFYDHHVSMGSVRLSIIDLASGQQPVSAGDNQIWIVYNGEIFNYIELREQLVRQGHVFHTKSDTEVLLHAYLQYGKSCLNRLNGQFAFAIWDCRKKELFLARDRVGIRPLFYTWHKNTFVFGSEIKSILEYPGITAGIDLSSLARVFTYWTCIPPDTVFQNIHELPPGCCMHICNGKQQIEQWWRLTFPAGDADFYPGNINEAGEELRFLLQDAVKVRLRADVPVAAYLSGGLDSSATTAIIKEVAPDVLQTFSIGFEGKEFDESDYQNEVSQFLNTRHTSTTCTNEEIAAFFPQVVWHSEIPILRTAPVPMFCLSKKVREQQIKVVITGEGADEMLAGYDIFKETVIREFWAKQPDSILRPLLFNRLYPYLSQFKDKNKAILKLFYGYKLEATDSPFYSHLVRWHNGSILRGYFSDDMVGELAGHEHAADLSHLLSDDFHSWSGLGKSQWLETVLFMSGYLLSSQGDRVAMANSVEGRYPFLDYRVIEFAAKLPHSFKMRGLNEKYILKKMMKGRIPERILQRPKQAYRAPVADSLFTLGRQAYVDELLSENGLQNSGLFDASRVSRLKEKIKGSSFVSEIDNMALAGILSTQILYHQYVAKDRFRMDLPDLNNCRKIVDFTL